MKNNEKPIPCCLKNQVTGTGFDEQHRLIV